VGLCPDCFRAYKVIKAGVPDAIPTRFDTMGTSELPDPRKDGQCANCRRKPAVTKDGRFCQGCMAILVRRLHPGTVRLGSPRTADQRQAYGEDGGPWGENATKVLEGE
jgi:hypothetical protein